MGVFCVQCGHSNPGEARYCVNCGVSLPQSSDAIRSSSDTTTAPHSRLEAAERAGAPNTGPGSGPITTPDPAAEAAAGLPPESALLLVRQGPEAGSQFFLDTDLTTAGRHPSNDIFLDDVTVSRRHAEFFRRDGVFGVRDVGSLNGTYVNRERVEEAVLGARDRIRIGRFEFVFVPSFAVEERTRKSQEQRETRGEVRDVN